jgi:8-oxo-dGTP pyrophosphatase MutT (NUDIX family)
MPTVSTLERLSCGIVILNERAELLLCHVTQQAHWDLPKGGAHAGESPSQAALRETREETGLQLSAATLLDLGRLAYRPKKDLHLFAQHASGKRLPEMDGYGWFAFARIGTLCTAKMTAVLHRRIDLPGVLHSLRRTMPIELAA